ncbi:MAG: hypothetical protein K2W95_32445, partial [Candidatus Obscuribacterales bacterium]|nr:hypothetical protein [Candidatus Obscuribacterales bacterium]
VTNRVIEFEYKPPVTNRVIEFEYKPPVTNQEPIVFEYRGNPNAMTGTRQSLPANPAQMRFSAGPQPGGANAPAMNVFNTVANFGAANLTGGGSTRSFMPTLPSMPTGFVSTTSGGALAGARLTSMPSIPTNATMMTSISGLTSGITAPVTTAGALTQSVPLSTSVSPVSGSITGTQISPSATYSGGSGVSTFNTTTPSFSTMTGSFTNH